MSKISCVLFDLGGVVVNWHDSWLVEEVSKTFNLSRDAFEKELEKNLSLLSTGVISEKELWDRIGQELNSSELKKQNSLLEPVFRKFVSVNEPVLGLTRVLKENGLSIGLLSNTESITFPVVQEIVSLDHFDFQFLSYEIGHIKPSSLIYKHVVENIPFKKEELFFIDDKESNVKSANDFGIKTIQFVSYEKLVEDLRIMQIL